MAKKEIYECEQCKGLGNKSFVFEGTLTKAVVNAPVFMPTTVRVEVCSMDCLIKKVKKLMSLPFEEKPINRKAVNNGKVEAQK